MPCVPSHVTVTCVAGLTVASRAYSIGSRAGRALMFRRNQYPQGAIGPVEFLWQPHDKIFSDSDTNGDQTSQTGKTCFDTTLPEGSGHPTNSSKTDTKLWMIVSPAIHDDVMTELSVAVEKFCCHGNPPPSGEPSDNCVLLISADDEERSKVKLTVTSLKDEFVQFRLIGPRSRAVVMETLKPISDNPNTFSESKTKSTSSLADLSKIPIPVPWWNGNETLPKHSRLLNSHLETQKTARSAVPLPDGTVLGMVVEDPRLRTPAKKTDMVSAFYPMKRRDWVVGGGGDIGAVCEGVREGREGEGGAMGEAVTRVREMRDGAMGVGVREEREGEEGAMSEAVIEWGDGAMGVGAIAIGEDVREEGVIGAMGEGVREGREEKDGAFGKEGEYVTKEDEELDRESKHGTCEEEDKVKCNSETETERKGSVVDATSKDDTMEEDEERDRESERSNCEETVKCDVETETESLVASSYTECSPGNMACEKFPPGLSYSPLWCERVRNIVKGSRVPDHLLNDVRSKSLTKIPELALGAKSPQIPVVLIKREFSNAHVGGVLQLGRYCCPGNRNAMPKSVATASTSVWDVMLPNNWGTAFWVSLIYRGARGCGLTELRKCHLECGVPRFPDDFPDTQAGRKFSEERHREGERKYCRYPPDKRRNYGKLSIQTPFHGPWQQLVREWQSWGTVVGDGVCSCDGGGEGEREREGARKKEGEGEREREEEKVTQGGMEVDPSVCDGVSSCDGEGEGETGCDSDQPPAKRPRICSNEEGEREREGEEREREGERERKQHSDVGRLNTKTESGNNYYVLRSKSDLFQLSHFFHSLRLPWQQSHSGTAPNPATHHPSFQALITEHRIDELLKKHINALVMVTYEMLRRGNTNNNDIISIPTLSDLQNLSSEQNFYGPVEAIDPKGVMVVDSGVVCVGVSELTRKRMTEVKRERKRKAKERRTAGKKPAVELSREQGEQNNFSM